MSHNFNIYIFIRKKNHWFWKQYFYSIITYIEISVVRFVVTVGQFFSLFLSQFLRTNKSQPHPVFLLYIKIKAVQLLRIFVLHKIKPALGYLFNVNTKAIQINNNPQTKLKWHFLSRRNLLLHVPSTVLRRLCSHLSSKSALCVGNKPCESFH